ncbi:MAG TPA: hypothetical protein VF614_06390, partial [Chthoniobacteraceae bacterium]
GEAIFKEDFESVEAGKAPAGFMVMAGTFLVKQEGAGKVLELPGAPLDTFGLLFGPAEKADVSASARFHGTSVGRKFPTFGISLLGPGGYRLQVSPAKKALEIYRGDQPRGSVPLAWTSGSWTCLRIQVRSLAEGVRVEGKAWPAAQKEPPAWTIFIDEKQEPPQGRAGIWGSPFSGTPILFDDLLIQRASDS